jgi:hypothetical protein
MSLTKDQILAEAMALKPREREELAEELLLSVSEILDPEWAAEIRRRLGEIDQGEELLDGDEVMRQARARVRS